MKTYCVAKSFARKTKITPKVAGLCAVFGLTADRLDDNQVVHRCSLEIRQGDIVYITGPSGCGKSVLLRQLEAAVPQQEKINLDQIKLPAGKTLIDCMPEETDIVAGMRLLSMAGLNDVFVMLEKPANLSDGQKYRFRLAMALAAGKKIVFADEFCSNLDRITAAVIAYNIRKLAMRDNMTFVLAASHEDILADLAPDVLVVKDAAGPAEVVYKSRKVKSEKLLGC